jgi:hypothetical protein
MARTARDVSAKESDAGSPTEAESPALPAAIQIRAAGCRAAVHTVGEAMGLIDDELPPELRRLPRWTFARALLERAGHTRRKRDLAAAVRQLRQALSNEGWLIEDGRADR